jgi:TPR repeat protein
LVESIKWFKVAAEGGIAEAQWHLSMAYRSGEGVAIDDREADRWEKLALEGGYTPDFED